VTCTTREVHASGFRLAALALGARDAIAAFFGSLDESLATTEVLATGLLGATLRLVTLCALTSLLGGRFDKAFATFKLLTSGLWRAALL